MLHDVPPLSACRGAGCRREARLVPRDMGRTVGLHSPDSCSPERSRCGKLWAGEGRHVVGISSTSPCSDPGRAKPPPTSRRTIEERIAKQSAFEEPITFANRRPGLGVDTTIASRGGRGIMPFPTSVSRGAFVGCRAVPLMLGERSAADALRHTHTPGDPAR